jgi:predicted glycosyltransferase involved in capsule biosynthesis
MFPSAEIIISEDKKSQEDGWSGFCKSKYINRGVRKAKHEIVFIADIDVILPKESIVKSARKLNKYDCVIPYNVIYHTNSKDAMRILGKTPWIKMPTIVLAKQKKVSLSNGRAQGLCLVKKSTFEKMGGYDERFSGWGSEDSAYLKAMETMTGKKVYIQKGDAYHLKHPIVKDRHKLRDQNVGELLDAYRKAEGNKKMMRKVIQWKH